jgi:hypothetical protein
MNQINFWDVHGVFFIGFMFLFPRLTLLFSSVISGGFLWWLGWIFAPRLLVAVLATTAYWHTNTILVILTWIWAIGLESGEKKIVINRRNVWHRQKYRHEDAIEAESKRLN